MRKKGGNVLVKQNMLVGSPCMKCCSQCTVVISLMFVSLSYTKYVTDFHKNLFFFFLSYVLYLCGVWTDDEQNKLWSHLNLWINNCRLCVIIVHRKMLKVSMCLHNLYTLLVKITYFLYFYTCDLHHSDVLSVTVFLYQHTLRQKQRVNLQDWYGLQSKKIFFFKVSLMWYINSHVALKTTQNCIMSLYLAKYVLHMSVNTCL